MEKNLHLLATRFYRRDSAMLDDFFSIHDLNNNISPREKIERRMNIISSIEGRLTLKIKLLNLTVLFGEFFDEITKNFYIN